MNAGTHPTNLRRSSPSPLNGKRAGVRGEHHSTRRAALYASEVAPASPAAHCQREALLPAIQPRLSPVPTGHCGVGDSKTAGSECSATSNRHHGHYPSPAGQGNHAGGRPIPDCSAPRRSKSRARIFPLCVAGGIYNRQTFDHAKSATSSSRAMWISSGERGLSGQNSWQSDRIGRSDRHGDWFFFAPLTLALSPLRGEGNPTRDRRIHFAPALGMIPQLHLVIGRSIAGKSSINNPYF